MSTEEINIYVDSTFSDFTPADGVDVEVDLALVDTDIIGARNIPTVFNASNVTDTVIDNTVVFTTVSGVEAKKDVEIKYRFNPVISGSEICLVDYSVVVSLDTKVIDSDVECFVGSSGYIDEDVFVTYITGRSYDLCYSILVDYFTTVSSFENLDYMTNYTAGEKKSDSPRDISVCYQMSSTASGSVNRIVDITFSGWVLDNYMDFDVYSCVSGTRYIDYELTTISGGVEGYCYDIFSTVSGVKGVFNDVYCCLVDYVDVHFETTVISGCIHPIYYDVWSTFVDVSNYMSFEVSLFSLKISNFSLGVGEYTAASGTICVDVTDDWYSVVTSGTYFMVDGTQVSGTFLPIVDGYRMCYDPIDDFSSLMGSTTVMVHAENSNGDVLEKNYYLTYGYFMSYDNIEGDAGVDFGYWSKVVVRMSAENLESCPVDSADAYWFETRHMECRDLGATIFPRRAEEMDKKDLSASIYPQSNAYFYEKEFEVIITASDFAGNSMSPFTFRFKIEDKPN